MRYANLDRSPSPAHTTPPTTLHPTSRIPTHLSRSDGCILRTKNTSQISETLFWHFLLGLVIALEKSAHHFLDHTLMDLQLTSYSLAYAEMRLIFAKILWSFDMALDESSSDWNVQKSYITWEKKPLMVKLSKSKHRKRETNG